MSQPARRTQRVATVLVVDADEVAAGELARALSARAVQVFYTTAAEVARRLSQEHLFDLVIVDVDLERESYPSLTAALARDRHRCLVLSVPASTTRLPRGDLTVDGALRRPLDADRIVSIASSAALHQTPPSADIDIVAR